MTVSCEFCGADNRASANFCIGCAAKLPGFAATGPSALEMLKGLERPTRRSTGAASEPPVEGFVDILRPLVVGGLLIMLAFIAWYLHVRRDAVPVPAQTAAAAAETTAPVVMQQPAFQQIAPFNTDLRALAPVSPTAQAAAARTTGLLARPDAAGDATEIVSRFYRALAAGDGRTAAEFVIDAKRAQGPLSGGAMSTFYRSLAEPLRLQSIRQVDAQIVEARYTYRATKTRCQGRALLTMDSPAPAARIRSISANC
ncbi:MAG: hypothetical protein EOO26_06620 [Comamonadaceae bacterium]|nr:MAG: hypothetical protein EOO26_06620 [Comamonadaceae bacterium]